MLNMVVFLRRLWVLVEYVNVYFLRGNNTEVSEIIIKIKSYLILV